MPFRVASLVDGTQETMYLMGLVPSFLVGMGRRKCSIARAKMAKLIELLFGILRMG